MFDKICSHCKTENSSAANYCRRCGFILPGGSAEVSSDKTLLSKISDLQNKIAEMEIVVKTKDNDLADIKRDAVIKNEAFQKLQSENSNLRSSLYAANQRVNSAEKEVKVAKDSLAESKSSKFSIHTFYLITLIFISSFGARLYIENRHEDSEISSLNYKNTELSSSVKSLTSTNDELQAANNSLSSVVEKVSGNTPLIVASVEVKDASTNYGAIIDSSNTTYLYFRFTAYSLVNSATKVYIKIYTPYGLSRGNSSPSGYSFDYTIYPSKNQTETFEISGWGNSEKGNWSPGDYRVEIWCKDKCIGVKSFTIY